MYARSVWNENTEDIQDITCPEFLRLSEGARFVEKKVAWSDNQKFYHILDLDTGKEHYGTTSETRLLVKIPRSGFMKKMRSKSARAKPLWNRYLINRIPRFLFIKITGREYDIQRNYFYRY